ncbi:putative transcriptional regulator SLK2 [Bidens hawaiensis]|uniref:putative transcriptional regulator SLK2 n=1 Tax=Bidens hawaiensis TaxID=980011 RepID=UPI004048FB4E
MVHSSPSSGIFFEEDEQSLTLRNSQLSPYVNPNVVPQNMYPNMVPVSGDLANGSSGLGSLVTNANSGSFKQGASMNTESYVRFPGSPLSFNSNNISISGSTVIDGPSSQQGGLHQGDSTATSLPNPRLGPSSMFHGPFVPDHDNANAYHLQKKPRVDNKQEDIMQQQTFRQLQLQSSNNQLQALYQSLPPPQQALLLQQLQSRQNGQQPASAVNRPFDGGVCSRRLMQYLYHQSQRPADITYWRKFVAEYYSPRAKQRWCLSVHNNVGHHPLGAFPPATTDLWQCSICGSKSGRGFEAAFEVIPRLNEIKFGSGVIDELWFLDLPREYRFSSGIMVLEYGKAVQESVYEQLRVVHEGRLKVVFAPDLKILSWEFCSRCHEELLPRRLVAPQVNQFLEVAQKLQSTIVESGSGGVSQQDLQTSSNMLMTAGRQLARSLELQSINDLGFTKRYVRSLQIAEVVNSMKDLMDFTQETKIGPIEALKRFPRKTSVGKSQMQRMQGMEQMSSGSRGIPNDRNAFGGLVRLQLGVNSSMNNNFQLGSSRGAMAHSNYQNSLMRQNSMNSVQNRSPILGQPLQINSNNIPAGYQRFPSGIFQQSSSQGGGQVAQNHIIQQALKGMSDGGAKPSFSGQSGVGRGRGGGGPTRSNSFKAGSGSHSDSCADDLPHVSDVFQDIASEFFNNESEDGFGFGWKA